MKIFAIDPQGKGGTTGIAYIDTETHKASAKNVQPKEALTLVNALDESWTVVTEKYIHIMNKRDGDMIDAFNDDVKKLHTDVVEVVNSFSSIIDDKLAKIVFGKLSYGHHGDALKAGKHAIQYAVNNDWEYNLWLANEYTKKV